MVLTPDIPNLPYRTQNGVKCFELVAEPVKREILPGLYINGWGYNGSIPGPTIQVYSGDCINIRVVNHLPEATSVHWPGLMCPIMDVYRNRAVAKIEPGGYFNYHFKITIHRAPICIIRILMPPAQQLMGWA